MIIYGFFKTVSHFSRMIIFFFQTNTLWTGFVLDKQKYSVNPNFIIFKELSLNLFDLNHSNLL